MSLIWILGGCGALMSLIGDPSALQEKADAQLAAGDIAGARATFDSALASFPGEPGFAIGAAYTRVLAGDSAGADAVLSDAQVPVGEEHLDAVGGLKLRRAIIALSLKKSDAAKELAIASDTAIGRVLAAEIELADGHAEVARTLLEHTRSEPGVVGETAENYLRLMDDADPRIAGVAEVQALWAIGEQGVAVRSAGDLLLVYAERFEDGPEQLLLWAGRATTAGEPAVAHTLLDAIVVKPAGQAWRVDATRAIALCVQGHGSACESMLSDVRARAPADGWNDACVTAAALVAGNDPELARRLLAGASGDAAARVWAELGEVAVAKTLVRDDFFRAQLGG